MMNSKKIDWEIFNYLLSIYQDFSIMIYRQKLDTPFFQTSYAVGEKMYWNHNFHVGGKLCVRVQMEKLDEEDILYNTLHLLIHMHNFTMGKADMSESANGRYHNTEFAQEAYRIGVICERTKNYGYQIREIDEGLKKECVSIIDRYYPDIRKYLQLRLAAQNLEKSSGSKQNYVKYRCPACHKTIKAVEGSYIICGICKTTFERI